MARLARIGRAAIFFDTLRALSRARVRRVAFSLDTICCCKERMSEALRSYCSPQISVLSCTLVRSALTWIVSPRCTTPR